MKVASQVGAKRQQLGRPTGARRGDQGAGLQPLDRPHTDQPVAPVGPREPEGLPEAAEAAAVGVDAGAAVVDDVGSGAAEVCDGWAAAATAMARVPRAAESGEAQR